MHRQPRHAFLRSLSAVIAVLATTLFTIVPAQAQDAPAAPGAETTYCFCKPPDAPQQCLSIDSSKLPADTSGVDDCSGLPSIIGETLKGWTCQAKPVDSVACPKPVDAFTAGEQPGVPPAVGSITASDLPPIVPVLNVPIPGLHFSDPTGGENPLLAQYLSAVYNYLISITATVATIVFAYGAFQYLLGSALPSIASGKRIMQEAVIGLLLVFSAHLILFTINPATVELKSLVVDPVRSAEYKNEDVLDSSVSLAPGASAAPRGYHGSFLGWSDSELSGSSMIQDPGGSAAQPLNIEGFYMFQGPWASKAYGPDSAPACPGTNSQSYSQAHCCTTYAHAGCGAASFATLLATAGVQTDPQKVGTVLSSLGARSCNTGTSFDGSLATRAGQAAGVTASALGRGIGGVKAAINALRSGQPVMFLCMSCTGKTTTSKPKSYGGHFMVLNGVDPTGRIFSVFDVGNPNPYGIVNILQSELASHTGGFWTVKK